MCTDYRMYIYISHNYIAITTKYGIKACPNVEPAGVKQLWIEELLITLPSSEFLKDRSYPMCMINICLIENKAVIQNSDSLKTSALA